MFDDGAARVELPSGGWWAIKTRVSYGDATTLAGLATVVDADGLARVLARLTVEWGFPEPTTPDSVLLRDLHDLDAVTAVIRERVIPVLERFDTRSESEALFEGLVKGELPAEYADVALMAATGWSWRDLQATPVDVVRRMQVYLAVRSVRDRGGELELGATGERSPATAP